MHNRAFVLHCMVTLARLIEYSSGRSMWDRWEDQDPSYKDDSIKTYLTYGKFTAWSLLVLGLIIDLLCFKWRGLARLIFHVEMMQICLFRLIPVNICSSYLYVIFFHPFSYAIMFACDLKLNLASLLLTQSFGNLFLSSLWLDQAE